MKAIVVALVAAGLTGCASITMEEMQGVRVDTFTKDGTPVSGAACRLANNFNPVEIKSGESGRVRRSAEDLVVNCKANGQPDANGTAISRINGGMVGNIIFGGAIGALIDHSNGKGYSYPAWLKLIFGESRTYDKGDERNSDIQAGKPVDPAQAQDGSLPANSAGAGAASSLASNNASPAASVRAPAVRLEDVAALPHVGERAKQGYREWLGKPMPRAFAISERGHWAGAWGANPADSTQPVDPSERAIAACQQRTGVKCRLYAVDAAVVW